MSHFSILVVGAVEHNMAPFHEFECTGRDDEFIKTIDITEDERKAYESKKAEKAKEGKDFKYKTFKKYLDGYCGFNFAESPEKVDITGKHKYSYFYPVEGTEDDFKVFRRTNPNSFYDYYGEGYEGFILKDGTTSNHALKKDIDFATIWSKNENKAREIYRKVINALGYTPSVEHTWKSLVSKFAPKDGSQAQMTREDAIEIYEAQKAVIDFRKLRDEGKLDVHEIGFFTNVDEFCMTEDEYVQSQCAHCITFGYVVNREYHSRGDMGWWAIVTNKKDSAVWDQEYKEFIESLPEDAELTILDCHV